jgi:hypothetical protein
MGTQTGLWLAGEPTDLPRYGHTASDVGSAIILFMIVLLAGVTYVRSKRG